MATRYQLYQDITVGEKSVERGCIKRILDDGTVSCIPMNEANTDYQAYLDWVAEGNTAEAATD